MRENQNCKDQSIRPERVRMLGYGDLAKLPNTGEPPAEGEAAEDRSTGISFSTTLPECIPPFRRRKAGMRSIAHAPVSIRNIGSREKEMGGVDAPPGANGELGDLLQA